MAESKESPFDLAELALLGFGIYLLWQLLGKAGSAASAGISSAAKAYVNLTSSAPASATGNIILPNGASIPASSVTPTFVGSSNVAQFSYQGQTYYLNTPHDANGNWQADTSPNVTMPTSSGPTDAFGNPTSSDPFGLGTNVAPLTDPLSADGGTSIFDSTGS
jgi:hypothetical protein